MTNKLRRKFDMSQALLEAQIRMQSTGSGAKATNSNYASHLPEVYSGAPNRVERYSQYIAMLLEPIIDASLEVIAEFCTQVDPVTRLPLQLVYNDTVTDNDTTILTSMLRAWIKTNNFENRLFDIVKDVLTYGDQFFVRDPETFELLWIYPGNVTKVIVNESQGKKPEQYVIRNFNPNLQNLTVSELPCSTGAGLLATAPAAALNAMAYNSQSSAGGQTGGRFNNGMDTSVVNAQHIVHINTTTGMNMNWPFGTSILEKIYKPYKQQELIEDSILIYRIQRSPQRRVFYLDTGEMPEHKAMAFVEQVKNSVNQRRVPSRNGGAAGLSTDASYSPISVMDDYYIPVTSAGRGSKIEVLPGGDAAWGMQELQYFANKLMRGLRVPTSYLPIGPDDSAATYNDGKVGAALIQEFRFSEHCKRIQRSLIKHFDLEFKLYLKQRDISIESNRFELAFIEPQSFVAWRQIELDTSRIQNFNAIIAQPYISKRWAMDRYLGIGMEEIARNHDMLVWENPDKFKSFTAARDIGQHKSMAPDLGSVGIDRSQVFAPQEPVPDQSQEPGSEIPQDMSSPAPINNASAEPPQGEQRG